MASERNRLQVVFAATALLCLAWLLWPHDEPTPNAPTVAIRPEPPAPVVQSALSANVNAPTRETATAAAPATTQTWADHPFPFELQVLSLDRTGLPVRRRAAMVAPPLAAFSASAVTADDGRSSATWNARQGALEVTVVDCRSHLHRIALHAGAPTTLAVMGALLDHGVAVTRMVSEDPETGSRTTTYPVNQRFTVRETIRAGLHPHAVFGNDVALGPAANRRESDPEDTRRFGVFPNKPAAPGARIIGTVTDEAGELVQACPVALLGDGSFALRRVSTDRDGRFEFDGIADGRFTVRAGGHLAGIGSTTIHAAGDCTANVRLQRGACVRGRFVTDAGRSVPEYVIAWRADDGSWCDESTSMLGDGFVLANLPATSGILYAWPSANGTLPTAFARCSPDGGEILLRHAPETLRTLRLEPALPEGCETRSIEIRVWQIETGIGIVLTHSSNSGPTGLQNLAPGWYQVEVRAAGCGIADLGRIWMDGMNDVDLGRTVLPRPGRVRFTLPDELVPATTKEREFEICHLRTDLDVRVWSGVLRHDQPMFLPAGDYALGYRHRDGSVKFVRFTVRSGEETVVTAQ